MNDSWRKRVEKVTKVDVLFFIKNAQGNITRKEINGLDPNSTLESLGIDKENSKTKIFSLSRAFYTPEGAFNKSKPLELENNFTLKKILENSSFSTGGCVHADCPYCDITPKLKIFIAEKFPNDLLTPVMVQLRESGSRHRQLAWFELLNTIGDIKSSFFGKEDRDNNSEIWLEEINFAYDSDDWDDEKKMIPQVENSKLTDELLIFDIIKSFLSYFSNHEKYFMHLSKNAPAHVYQAVKQRHEYNLSQMFLPQPVIDRVSESISASEISPERSVYATPEPETKDPQKPNLRM